MSLPEVPQITTTRSHDVESICARATQALRLTVPRGLTVNVLHPADVEQAIDVVVETFLTREPVCRTLRTWNPSFEKSLRAWVRDGCVQAADAELSVVVTSPTGQIVYVQIALPYKYDPNDASQANLPGAEPMVDILDQLSVLYGKFPVSTEPAVELVCAAVAKEWQKYDIAALIVQVAGALAVRRGFEALMTKASSHSQLILKRIGFQAVCEVPYQEYTWKGERVLAGIESPRSINIMWARVGDIKDKRGNAKL